jgi:hypothetical protein
VAVKTTVRSGLIAAGLIILAEPGIQAEHFTWWGFALMGILAGVVGTLTRGGL